MGKKLPNEMTFGPTRSFRERDAHAGRDTAYGNRENGSTGARARDLRFFYGVLSCYCPYVITVI
jgi:hypothetical protein